MDLTGLASRISQAVIYIDVGRKGFAIKGKAEEGRMSYEDGIEIALAAFQEAQVSADPQAIILAEYTFVTQEFQLCNKNDTESINSLKKAIESFKDAILALKAVEQKCYKIAEDIFPHDNKYRVRGFPKDSFHRACDSHKTRLRNILRFSGIDPIEKSLLKQRLANLPTAQNSYIEKQRKAMTNE